MDEIELDNFGNWFHLLGSIGFDWDELGGRLRLVRFGSDSLGDNNWLFLLDGFLLFFGRLLDGFGDDDRFGRGNLPNGFGNLNFDYLGFLWGSIIHTSPQLGFEFELDSSRFIFMK